MKYDFDRVIDRRNTYSIKFSTEAFGKPEGTLPLWVADMDFQAPPCVIDAMTAHCRHGIFGYSDTDDPYFEALRGWFSRRFGWEIEKEWLVKTPGIVNAVNMAIRALTGEGDAVLIQEPVYYPFASCVRDTGRKLSVSELVYENGEYLIDFEDFERAIREDKVKLFILCNPHNPVGRVWKREELIRLGEICLKHGVIVISDEIHQDFIYEGHRHLVFADIDPRFRDITITCTAPSKTFNLAGLHLSNIFIANSGMRKKFISECRKCAMSSVSVMGVVACRAAYEGGEEWLEQLLDYLSGNIAFLRDFLAEHLPKIRLVEPQGTYLAWLDFRALGLETGKLDDLIVNQAKLWLDDGPMFGAGGEGFQRVNIACPRSVLQEALIRLERVFSVF